MDGIERELAGEADVIRIDALSGIGRPAALRYGVRAVPTLLVFNACGEEIDRQGGMINARRAIETVRSAPVCTPPEEP